MEEWKKRRDRIRDNRLPRIHRKDLRLNVLIAWSTTITTTSPDGLRFDLTDGGLQLFLFFRTKKFVCF